jgi:hypothetical protein
VAPGGVSDGSRLSGQHHVAELLGDRQIRLAGEMSGSLSSAGAAVKQAVLGPEIPESVRATDGWQFWLATDARAGDTTTLRVMRQRVAADRTRDWSPRLSRWS